MMDIRGFLDTTKIIGQSIILHVRKIEKERTPPTHLTAASHCASVLLTTTNAKKFPPFFPQGSFLFKKIKNRMDKLVRQTSDSLSLSSVNDGQRRTRARAI